MSQKQILLDKIADRSARIGVIGLGYVGLPLAVEFAHSGFRATGFEVDARKADTINQGQSYIIDVPAEQVAALVKAERLHATIDFTELAEQDIIIICVPTPLRKTKEPDVSYILAAAEKIQDTLHPGQLIILESTTYPGTTDEVLRPMFDEKGFSLDNDYFLAFSPERVDPGNPQFQTKNIPKVVGGVTEDSADVAAAAYGAVVDNVHRVASARAAEMAKLLENTFRAVNIGMVNELSQLCYTLGIDTWEVIEAAATKPFGFMAFYPGPGIGGHCLVGEERVVVREAKTKKQRTIKIADLFQTQNESASVDKFQMESGAEVICRPALEALSLNQQTQRQEWKPVSYLFRRKFEGNLVTITTCDNRKLTVTDEHPMLVCNEPGSLRTIFAKDLQKDNHLPVQTSATVSQVAVSDKSAALQSARRITQRFDKIATAQVIAVTINATVLPVDVYSIEVEDNHTFVTSHGIYVHNCIPLDPHYLSWKARMHGFEARFISLAEEVNSTMPEHVVGLVQAGLNKHRKPVNGSRVVVLGVAYKRDIDDMRESPALGIIEKLEKLGAEVSFHDPHVNEIRLENGARMTGVALTEQLVADADCVVIVTDHRAVDYRWVAERAKLIVDTRNATRDLKKTELAKKIIHL